MGYEAFGRPSTTVYGLWVMENENGAKWCSESRGTNSMNVDHERIHELYFIRQTPGFLLHNNERAHPSFMSFTSTLAFSFPNTLLKAHGAPSDQILTRFFDTLRANTRRSAVQTPAPCYSWLALAPSLPKIVLTRQTTPKTNK